MLDLINFFDIPIVFAAITSTHSLPLPTTLTKEIVYNHTLQDVFDRARESSSNRQNIGNIQLWQLFGSMIYPQCINHKRVVCMFNFVAPIGQTTTVQQKIKDIVLGTYKQKNPEAYSHLLHEWNKYTSLRQAVSVQREALSVIRASIAAAGTATPRSPKVFKR